MGSGDFSSQSLVEMTNYLKQTDGLFYRNSLGAEKVISAEKGGEKIAVEVKSFGSPSVLNAFHEALGQYLDYRDALEEAEMNREMYLGISLEAYYQIQDIKFLTRRISKYTMKIIVVDVESNTVQQWIK